MDSGSEDLRESRSDIDPAAFRRLAILIAGILIAGLAAFLFFRPSASPPPVDIASDAFLTQGRTLFLDRCASCHGQTGRGDGPIAKTLKAGHAEDLTDPEWKFGSKPEEVMAVISKGTPNGEMPGWGSVFAPDDLKAVAGYIYYLAKQSVPQTLRPAKLDPGG